MRIALLVAVFCVSTLLSSAAQAPVSTNPQALTLLQNALTALSPNITTHDVTLTGSANYIAGSDNETGTGTLEAIATGASSVNLTLPSGSRTEVRNLTANPPTGTWSGPDGVNHLIVSHNLLNEPSWFAPACAISRILVSSESVASYVDAETLESQSVQHVAVVQQPPATAFAPEIFPHLTQIDLYLDSSTYLPAAMKFTIHPDDDELVDIPIEVRFSDYRTVNGTQIPFHVQRFLDNGLVLDLQFETAAINSGLSPSVFASQSLQAGDNR
jgi:hypothetical protein